MRKHERATGCPAVALTLTGPDPKYIRETRVRKRCYSRRLKFGEYNELPSSGARIDQPSIIELLNPRKTRTIAGHFPKDSGLDFVLSCLTKTFGWGYDAILWYSISKFRRPIFIHLGFGRFFIVVLSYVFSQMNQYFIIHMQNICKSFRFLYLVPSF